MIRSAALQVAVMALQDGAWLLTITTQRSEVFTMGKISPATSAQKRARIRAVRGLLIAYSIALSSLVAGCQTFDVQTDWDSELVFDGFNRFHWVEPPEAKGADPFADNTLLRKRIRNAVEKVLAERGYQSVATASEADFLVTYSVLLDERLKVDGFTSSIGNGIYNRNIGFQSGISSASVRAYQEATLILDLLDPSSEGLVWRGWGTRMLRTRDQDRGQDRLEAGVRAILDRFPPDAGS